MYTDRELIPGDPYTHFPISVFSVLSVVRKSSEDSKFPD